MAPPIQDFRCTVPGCSCTRFSSPIEKSRGRICDGCRHGWVVHAFDAIDRCTNANINLCVSSLPSFSVIQSMASLVLYGIDAIPIRLKVLLDRLFTSPRRDKIGQLLSDLGWTEEDYGKGYIFQDSSGHELKKWTMPSEEEEVLILEQFLRFPQTRLLAEEFLSSQHSNKFPRETEYRRFPLAMHNPTTTTATRYIQERLTSDLFNHIRSLDGSCNGSTCHDIFPYTYPPPSALTVAMGPLVNPLSSPVLSIRTRDTSVIPLLPTTSPRSALGLGEYPIKLTKNLNPYDFLNMPNCSDVKAMAKLQSPPRHDHSETRNGQSRGYTQEDTDSPGKSEDGGQMSSAVVKGHRSFSYRSNETSVRTEDGAINYSTKSRSEVGEVGNSAKKLSSSENSSSKFKTASVIKRRHSQQLPGYGGIMISSSGKKRVLCTACKKTFCDKGALKIHYSAVHLKEMHKCTLEGCDMMFSSRRSRNRHSANPNPKLHTSEAKPRQVPTLTKLSITADSKLLMRDDDDADHHRNDAYSESSSCSSWMTREDDVVTSSPMTSEGAGGHFTGVPEHEIKHNVAIKKQNGLSSSSSHPISSPSKDQLDKALRIPSKRKTAIPTRWAPAEKVNIEQEREGNKALSSAINHQSPMIDTDKNKIRQDILSSGDCDGRTLCHDEPLDCSKGSADTECIRIKKCKRNLFGDSEITAGGPPVSLEDTTTGNAQKCKNNSPATKQTTSVHKANVSSSRSSSSVSFSTICSQESTSEGIPQGLCEAEGSISVSVSESQNGFQNDLCTIQSIERENVSDISTYDNGSEFKDYQQSNTCRDKPCTSCGKQFHSHFSTEVQTRNEPCWEATFSAKRNRGQPGLDHISPDKIPVTKTMEEENAKDDVIRFTKEIEDMATDDGSNPGAFHINLHYSTMSTEFRSNCHSVEGKRTLGSLIENSPQVASPQTDRDLTCSSDDSTNSCIRESLPERLPTCDHRDQSSTTVSLRSSPDRGVSVTCHICLQLFRDNLILKEHFEKVHPKEMYLCNIKGCNKVFSTRKSRNRHSQNENLHRHLS